MGESVKRDDALRALEQINPVDYGAMWDYEAHHYAGECLRDCKEAIENIHAADVAPVVHGHWIEKQEETYCPVQYGEDGNPILHKYTRYICNLCGRRSVVPEPYCHCGAKMDGGVSDEAD